MYIIYTMYVQSRHVFDLMNVPGQNDVCMKFEGYTCDVWQHAQTIIIQMRWF